MIQGKGRNRWFMIYLTTLVLLFNLEFVYEAAVRQGGRYRELVIDPALPRPFGGEIIDESSSRTTVKER